MLAELFSINGSRWNLIDSNFPVVGEEPLVQGRELYPFGLTRAAVEQYVAAHPDEKAAIYSPQTVVRSAPLNLHPKLRASRWSVAFPAKLYTYPYHVAFAEWVKPMAEDLCERRN